MYEPKRSRGHAARVAGHFFRFLPLLGVLLWSKAEGMRESPLKKGGVKEKELRENTPGQRRQRDPIAYLKLKLKKRNKAAPRRGPTHHTEEKTKHPPSKKRNSWVINKANQCR